MKLLGILHRGSNKSSTANDANAPTSNTNHYRRSTIHNNNNTNSISPFRRNKHTRPVPHPHRRQESNSNNSIFSLPVVNGYDDHTVDANTLFEWSVADNAPSVGSIADLFQETPAAHERNHDILNNHRDEDDHDHNHSRKKVKSTKIIKSSSKIRNMLATKKRNGHGYGSSSDEEEEGMEEEEDHDHVLEQQFQYCKLDDSPPRPDHKHQQQQHHTAMGSSTTAHVDDTPVRKGKAADIAPLHSEKLSSPSRVQGRFWRNGTRAIPVQALRNVVATTGVSKVGGGGGEDERRLCAELKGRIHAVSKLNSEKDQSFDQSVKSSSHGSPSSSVDDASIENVGNANSPLFHVVAGAAHRAGTGVAAERMEDLSMFDSTRNLGDMNHDLRKMHGKDVEHDVEPEFTFSITQEDLFGSDVESIWLLNDGDDSDASTNEALHNGDNDDGGGSDGANKKLDALELKSTKQPYSLKTLATDGAVVGDESAYNSGKWNNLASRGMQNHHQEISSSCDRNSDKNFRSKVKNQVKNKFQSIVKKKNKGQDVSAQVTANCQMEKPKVKRLTSE